VAIGESLSIGSNLVVGRNIINSGDIYTKNIYADSINIRDSVIQNLTLGSYFINIGFGTFPIYGSISDFSLLGLSSTIRGDRDSFIIMPYYALFVFSEINQSGKYLSMGNLSNNIEYFNISPLFRVKSCTLYKWNFNIRIYEGVSTVNNINPEKTWN
jgi:hypothetical protein